MLYLAFVFHFVRYFKIESGGEFADVSNSCSDAYVSGLVGGH